jgi:hypothetical protein
MDIILFSRAVRREAPAVLILKKTPPRRVPQGGAKERPYVMTPMEVKAQSEAA